VEHFTARRKKSTPGKHVGVGRLGGQLCGRRFTGKNGAGLEWGKGRRADVWPGGGKKNSLVLQNFKENIKKKEKLELQKPTTAKWTTIAKGGLLVGYPGEDR